MSLNIKDPTAHELAKALAEETGESMTQVVIQSLRERLERLQRRNRRASADELMAIGKRSAAGMSVDPIDHADFLYDEQG